MEFAYGALCGAAIALAYWLGYLKAMRYFNGLLNDRADRMMWEEEK